MIDRYKEMYCRLFNEITDVIAELEMVQRQTEEMFLMDETEKDLSVAIDLKPLGETARRRL